MRRTLADPHKFRVILATLSIITAVSFAAAGWTLYARFSQTNQARKDNRATWHAVICVIEQATLKNPRETSTDKIRSLRFFDRLLVENVGAAPCGLRIPRT